MNLIDNHMGDPVEQRVRLQTPQQDPSCHEYQPRSRRDFGLQADLVAHRLTHLLTTLISHTAGHSNGRQPPRLSAQDIRSSSAALLHKVIKQELWDLRRLSTPCFSADQHNLMSIYRGHDFVSLR